MGATKAGGETTFLRPRSAASSRTGRAPTQRATSWASWVGCMACGHAGFTAAAAAAAAAARQPARPRSDASPPACAAPCAVEKAAHGQPAEERARLRRDEARPVLGTRGHSRARARERRAGARPPGHRPRARGCGGGGADRRGGCLERPQQARRPPGPSFADIDPGAAARRRTVRRSVRGLPHRDGACVRPEASAAAPRIVAVSTRKPFAEADHHVEANDCTWSATRATAGSATTQQRAGPRADACLLAGTTTLPGEV